MAIRWCRSGLRHVCRVPLEKIPGFTPEFQQAVAERARGSGAEIIRLKGGAGWAVAVTIAAMVHAIALDTKRLLPVSTLQQGRYGFGTSALASRPSSAVQE